MNSRTTVLASLSVLSMLLLLAGRTPGANTKAASLSTTKRFPTGPAVKPKEFTAAALSGTVPANSPSSSAVYINSAKVEAARSGNHMVYDGDPENRPYKVITRNRDGGPEAVDVHLLQSDIWYVLGGNATVVTGGTVVNAKAPQPNQIKGTAIDGGEPHHLSKGDVLIIPKGVPHWVKEVQQAPFFYMEFKFNG